MRIIVWLIPQKRKHLGESRLKRYKKNSAFCWNSFLADDATLPNGNPGWVEKKYDEDVPNLVFDENAPTSCYKDFSGLKNCQIIAESGKLGELTNYPAFYAAKLYNDNNPKPTNATDWFLPSSGQWLEVMHGLGGVTIDLADFYHSSSGITLTTQDSGAPDPHPEDFNGCVIQNINSYLKKVGSGYTLLNTSGSSSTRYDDEFWTSTETDGEDAVYARMYRYNSNYSINISSNDKNYYNNGGGSNAPRSVRCILAF